MKKAILTGFFALAMVLSPVLSTAQMTPAQLQEQIVALQAQLAAMQAELAAQLSPVTSCPTFNRNLREGSHGADVSALQTFLKAKGYYSGAISLHYNVATVNAVTAYQMAKGMQLDQSSYGVFGPRTREAVNADCSAPVATPPIVVDVWGITVTSPNGGENWKMGERQTITWESLGIESNKDVSAYIHFADGATCYLGDADVGDEEFEFLLRNNYRCNNLSRNITAGSDYKVSLYVEPDDINVADFSYKDSSDAYFSISNRDSRSPYVVVTYPNGGEVLNNGGKDTIATIKWDRFNFQGRTVVDIGLTAENGSSGTYDSVADNVPNTGEYVWKSNPSIASGNYRIVVSTNNRDVQDKSDNYFTLHTVTGGSSETYFTFPKPNSTLLRGAWYTLQWTAPVSYSYDTEVYLVKGGNTQSKIATVSSPQSSYQWTVPIGTAYGNDYQIKLVRGGQALKISENFTIDSSAGEGVNNKQVSLTMPTTNFTQNYETGVDVSYSWKANYTVERSWFQLINSSGEIKNAGSAGTYNQGASVTSRTMNFPAYLGTGTYTLKVCDVTTSAVTPTSVCASQQIQVNAPAAVAQVKFKYPTASSKLIRGAWYTVSWENVPSNVYDLDLYFVQGNSASKLPTMSYGASSYQWTVPNDAPLGTSNKLRLVNRATGQTLKESDSFEIIASAGESVANKNVTLNLSTNTVIKHDYTTDLSLPFTWKANYTVERSWFQLIDNTTGEIKNAGGAGTFTLDANPTSRTLGIPAYLGTGSYTLKVCDVTTGGVSASSPCGSATFMITSGIANGGSNSQTANILESLKKLLEQLR